jgi:hypothetical protein
MTRRGDTRAADIPARALCSVVNILLAGVQDRERRCDAAVMPDRTVSYRLFAVVRDAEEAGLRLLGAHRSFEVALQERDADVIRQLEDAGGWYLLVEHLIVGPGLRGPWTVHPLITALGVDPAREDAPDAADLADACHWLAAIHARH